MTAVASNNSGACEVLSSQSPIAVGRSLPLQASSQVGRGQFSTFDASGDAAMNDGATPGLVSAGRAWPEILSDSSPVAGKAFAMHSWAFSSGVAASTISSDGFTKADMGTAFFIVDENTPGKLSNSSGSNRSIGGLVFGVDDKGNPICWSGPLAQLLARAALIAKNFPLASFGVADAAASTTIAERIIRRPKVKGTVTDITYTGSALAVGDTDYVTISIAKRDGAGGGAVVLGTYDSRAAGNGAATAFVPKAFTLSVVAGALFLLETDVVTITTTKGNSGQVLTGEILVNGKAI